MTEKREIENPDVSWIWDIVKQLKDFMDGIKSWFSDMLWIEELTQQEAQQLQQEIQQWAHPELQQENPPQSKEVWQDAKEKMSPWEKIWKFVVSKWLDPRKVSASFAKNWTNTDKDVVLNWPLFAPWWNPVWWYIENWKVKKDFLTTKSSVDSKGWNFKTINWIIGCDTNWKMHMFSYKDIDSQEWSTITKTDWEKISFKWAFQNGPMLVQDGNVQTSNSSKKVDRTAIWFTKTWEIRAVQASSVTLWEFADFCKNQWLSDTMYLDWSKWIAGLKDWKAWSVWWWFASWATWLQLW